ncbi:acyltransferase family protein [Luteolibacter sp. Populi]|uniref:acyltransferase family protein n=1 Tax=Luteolibacter sp. Populi TaxID=3230487 RepID=UPI0034663906
MTPPSNALLAGDAPSHGGADISYAPGPTPAVAAVAPASKEKPPAKAKERYVYLDAMKGLMILWGIPVHACVVSHSKFFKLVSDISNCVRMEAFFMISGFLTYMLVKRYGAGTIMRKRTVAVGLPLLSVVALLNPFTNWLILKYKGGAAVPGLKDFFTGQIPPELYHADITWGWHLHIWFLVVLLTLASMSGPIMTAIDRALAWSRPRLARLPDEVLLFLVALVAIGCVVAARIGYEAAVKPYTHESFHYLLRMVGYYFGFFALGMAMYASPRVLGIFTRCHWIQLFVSCGLLWAARLWKSGFAEGSHSIAKKMAELVNLAAEAYLAVIAVAVLFTFFRRFCSGTGRTMWLSPMHWVQLVASGVMLFAVTGLQGTLPAALAPGLLLGAQGYFFVMVCLVIFGLFEHFSKDPGKVMHFIVESAFCVYLFHYLVIYLCASWLRNFIGDDFTLSFLVTLGTTAVTMLIYEYAVRRNGVLRCLFLGKLPKREKAKA